MEKANAHCLVASSNRNGGLSAEEGLNGTFGKDLRQYSHQMLQAVSRSSSVGLAVLDRSYRYSYINSSLARMNGFPPDFHIGRTVGDVLGAFAAALEPKIQFVFDSGRA